MEGNQIPPAPPITGPGSIGHLAAIAGGTYIITDIVEVIAPAEAFAGDSVTIEVRVKNLFNDWLWLAVTGYEMDELADIFFSPDYAIVDPYQTHSFTYSFTMPDRPICFAVFSWYSEIELIDDELIQGTPWISDDWTLVPIALAGVPGRLEDVHVWDNKAKEWVAPPLLLSLGDYIAISAMCSNWTDDYLNIMLEAEYISPTGVSTVTTKTAMEAMYSELGPDQGIRLSPGGIYLEEAGEWSCHLRFYDGPDRGRLLDEWQGVIAQIPVTEVYTGTISKMELEYDESRADIPAHGIPQDKRGLVHIWGRNDTNSYQTLGIGWVVTDPDGQEVERHENDWAAGWVGPGEDREFIGGRFNLDKEGTYGIAIALYMNSADPVEIDSYVGILCTVALVGVGIELKAQWNYVVYTGKAQRSLDALASIAPYIDPDTVVWYWNNLAGEYEMMETPGVPVYDRYMMVPYGLYSIKVLQECSWTYGADVAPPDSVQLYGDRWNYVPYCGPARSVLDGFASIINYVEVAWRWDNELYDWVLALPQTIAGAETEMVPNAWYAVYVTQDCEWIFEVEIPPEPEFAGFGITEYTKR